MTDALIGHIAGAISARTPVALPGFSGSQPAKALGGLAALLVLAGLLALGGLVILPAGDAEAQNARTALDADGDNLIEVEDLVQLNAIRWDLDGDGDVDDGSDPNTPNTDAANYERAFFSGADGSCSGCTGYELTADLDFDTGTAGDRTDDTYYNSGAGWTPIGSFAPTVTPYTATFDGKGHTISNLFIDQDTSTGADDPDNRASACSLIPAPPAWFVEWGCSM